MAMENSLWEERRRLFAELVARRGDSRLGPHAVGAELEPWADSAAQPLAEQNIPFSVPAAREEAGPKADGGFRKELFDLFIEFFCREKPVGLKGLVDTLEKSIIVKVLNTVEGNQREAAKILGLKYTTLNEKVKRYGIRFQKSVDAAEL